MLVDSPRAPAMTDDARRSAAPPAPAPRRSPPKRRPGRPPTYVFSKPDAELSENERRLKGSVIKRRLRQNRSYHRKKRIKELAQQAARSGAVPAAASASASPPTLAAAAMAISPGPFSHPCTVPLPTLSPLPALSTLPAPPHSQQQILGGASVEANPMHYVPEVVSRGYETTSTNASVSVSRQGTLSSAMRLPVSSAEMTAAMHHSSPVDRLIGTTYFNTVPRFDDTLVQGPTSNVEVRVDTSGGIPFLSIAIPKTAESRADNTSIRGATDSDEAQLLEEILQASNQRTTTNSPDCSQPTTTARSFLSRDLDERLSSLPKAALDGLKHLVLFPASFDSDSAMHVMGLTKTSGVNLSNNILQPLVEVKLLRELPCGRFELNEITKSLISTDSFEDAREARERFVSHFIDKLRSLDATSLCRKGPARLHAMRMYDVERKNMDVAMQMSRDIGRKDLIVEFLTLGATVMRYSMPAQARAALFGEVLCELDSAGPGTRSTLAAEARMRLALAEALFDSLDFDKGEEQLRRAIGMMADGDERSVPVTLSVLALLLLAEVRMRGGETGEAKKLLNQALQSAEGASLGASTFAACGLLGLSSVHVGLGEFDAARDAARKALQTLGDAGFRDMPGYADALLALGVALTRGGDAAGGQRALFGGLALVQRWMGREAGWDSAPFQHCAYLDIFLVEGIAEACDKLGRAEEAGRMRERARQQRMERRLGDDGRTAEGVVMRHLY